MLSASVSTWQVLVVLEGEGEVVELVEEADGELVEEPAGRGGGELVPPEHADRANAPTSATETVYAARRGEPPRRQGRLRS